MSLLLELAYGEAESLPGYLPSDESDEVHPDAIAVTDDGRLLVTDPAKRRFAVFESTTGEYLGSIHRDGTFGEGVAWCPAGIATLDTLAHELLLLDDTGELLAAYALPEQHRYATNVLNASNSGVWAWGDGERFKVLEWDSEGRPAPAEAEDFTLVDRFAYGSHIYWHDYANRRIVREATGADPELSVAFDDGCDGPRVVGEAADGSFYVLNWNQAEGSWIVVFDALGSEVSRLPLVEWSIEWLDLWVTPAGTVYQLWYDREGIAVYVYESDG